MFAKTLGNYLGASIPRLSSEQRHNTQEEMTIDIGKPVLTEQQLIIWNKNELNAICMGHKKSQKELDVTRIERVTFSKQDT